MSKENKNNVHEIEIKIENEAWEKALDASFEKKVKKIKVDGFRKGKCPRNIFEKKFGKESLYLEAADYVLPEAYESAVKKDNLIPIIEPKVDIKKIDENGITFLFTITTKPEVKISKYKDLGVKKAETKVTKKEVDAEIEKLLDKYADIVVKDGKIENGDTAIIDFEGFIGDTPFEGGKGENYPLVIGSGSFIPGFEEQLIGLKSGEETDVKVKFPEDYHAEDLKGKDAVFKVKVHEVKTKEKPKMDKEFFLDLGFDNVNTEEELRDLVKVELEAQKDYENDNKYVDDLLEAVNKNTTVDVPEELVNEEIDRMIKQYEQNLQMQGVTLEMFYQFTNSDEQALRDQMREEALKRVQYRFILEEIAILEKIEISDEDADKEAEELSKKYNMTKEELLKQFGGIEMIKYNMQMEKAIDVLK